MPDKVYALMGHRGEDNWCLLRVYIDAGKAIMTSRRLNKIACSPFLTGRGVLKRLFFNFMRYRVEEVVVHE